MLIFYAYNESNGQEYYHDSWYADSSYFVTTNYPWFTRGGFYGDVLVGQLAFSFSAGAVADNISFRVVLALV